MAVIRSVALTLANHKHSKAYAASIESVEGGGAEGRSFIVCSTYGAIGSIQKPGKGIPKPVTLETAEKFYNKLVTEKTTVPCSCCAGLYVITGAAAATSKPIVGATLAHFPAFFPELLEPIAENETNRYLQDDQYSLEEKFDGTRLSVNLDADVCAAYNRLGGFIPVPVEVEKAVRALGCGNIWLDGEFEFGKFVIYDLLQFEGEDYREHAQSYRRQQLERLIVDGAFIRLSREFLGTADKTAALAMFRKRGIEGVVFKHRRKPYMPGKVGVNRKLKFWESATVRVGPKTKNDSAHSFGVEVLDAGVWKNVGNVTCKGQIPTDGTFRECKYLYVGAGGRLYQPEDLGERTDVTDADCDAAKLKHKATARVG
jgi:ATP-dependent DNA ligase